MVSGQVSLLQMGQVGNISSHLVTLNFATYFVGFHDCVDACDGCINLKIASNAGLDSTVNYLNKIYR